MTAKRTEIRNAAQALLTGLPTAGANVFQGGLRILQPNQVPALVIGIGDQVPGEINLSTGLALWSEAELLIELIVKESDSFRDTLDALLDEVIGALLASDASRTLGGLLIQPMREGTVGEPDFDFVTDKPVARLIYRQRVAFVR